MVELNSFVDDVMTLYEEFVNGLNVIVYCNKAYENLKKAIYIHAEAEGNFDERDIEHEWNYLIEVGDISFISGESLELIKNSFKVTGNYIDAKLLAMIRAYERSSIGDFLEIYGKNKSQFVNREESRMIRKIDGLASDFEILDCVTTKGVRRFNNDDFTCSIMSNGIKLLMVCDGVGGSVCGEKASEIVVRRFIEWFNSYDFSLGTNGLEAETDKVLRLVRNQLSQRYYMAATTLTMAIILEDETLMCSIGDSRAYTIKNGVFTQVTEDDTEVWEKYYMNE